jgi:nucleotide-binding universal stress UspA family protein
VGIEVVLVSSSEFLLAVAVAWLVIGAALSLVLGWRGHSGFSWFVLGTLLGPLAIGLAISSWRSDEHPEPRVVAGPAADVDGVDVLAGFDGSPESRAALDAVIELLGSRLGRLTIATVVPFDGGADEERSALGALDREKERLAWLAPGLEVLKGHPATALTTRATEDGYQLLAIGTRGHGLFGSAASELARTGKIPVLLVGDGKTWT